MSDQPITDQTLPDQRIEAVAFYWRPGCGFCMMLDRNLAKAGVPTDKHNIWDDPTAAAAVREWASGNETVPTVVIDDVGLVNPSAEEVILTLSRKAPHLVPEGWTPPEPGRVGRAVRRILAG